jgi:hypothetical protein
MADVKISALPAGTASANAIVPATNAAGTLTEKITLGSIAGLAAGIITPAAIGAAATSHVHSIANVTGLQTSLDGKAATSHVHSIADVTGLQTSLDGKAAASHTHPYATQADITTAINGLIDSAPGTLNTLNELAAALNDDASYATTVTTALNSKVTNSGNVSAIRRLTQAQYNALATPDANTLYVIVG